jgi:hypothetical protein
MKKLTLEQNHNVYDTSTIKKPKFLYIPICILVYVVEKQQMVGGIPLIFF